MRFYTLAIFLFFVAISFGQKFYSEALYGQFDAALVGNLKSKEGQKIKIDTCSFSYQVTLADYKVFLSEMKRDSGQKCYVSLLPDSSTVPDKGDYDEYLNSGKYDRYPAVGVSWINAMSYCKWRTQRDNKDSIRFIYRLPDYREWFFAQKKYSALSKNDFNKSLFADWVMDTQDESAYEFSGPFAGYYYLEKKDEPKVLKRKRTAGKNWYFSPTETWNVPGSYGYSDSGYKFVSFRIVKVPLKKHEEPKNEVKEYRSPSAKLPRRRWLGLEERILIWWGVKF